MGHCGREAELGLPLSFIGPTFMPVVVEWWFDVSGSYRVAYWALAGLYVLAAVLVWWAKRPTYMAETAV